METNIDNTLSEQEILTRIGAKLKEIRLEQDMKQKDLAGLSGLSMFSISQMETGHNTSVLSLVQVLKALNRLDMIEPFFRERPIDQEALARFLEKQPVKRRASSGDSSKRENAQPAVKRYFLGEEDDVPVRMAADDSEIEYGKKR